ncbi:hypothetical protein HPB51_012658 [Rhipicephalus microplus]|uniref:Peptidase M13 C-terminal domain-containing protein n=1 Tax=Rhipicephalus microplus TaxID=6941 RepID=A0A9J6E218_RHIMP|nr:hypothetical protein HPB51_012658 [Rhipicephalus microplus]
MVPYGPDPYNYGAIGKVIGHELTHAFDPKFIDVSPKGEKHIFYSPKFAQKLAELQECIILQANKLTESAVAGNNSVSEAFADSAGVEVAHLAYSSLPEPDRKAGIWPVHGGPDFLCRHLLHVLPGIGGVLGV